MDLHFSEADLEFRAHAREWLTINVPTSKRPAHGPGAAQFDRDWQRKLYDSGWAGVTWPKEFGVEQDLGLRLGIAAGHLV